MPNDQLNYAIQLIQQGQSEQAQTILQTLIRANQQDMTAWSWYVKSCRTPEKRLEALELCLRFNPGNPQVTEAIRVLREKLLEKQIFSFVPEPKSEPIPLESYPYAVAPVLETAPRPEAVISQPAKFVGMDGEVGRPFAWYDVWWMAMTQPNVISYTALLRDTNASPARGYWWIFWAGLIIQLMVELGFYLITHQLSIPYELQLFAKTLSTSNFPELQRILAADHSGQLMLIASIFSLLYIPLAGVFHVFWLIIGSAIYNLVAKLFGGTGNFARTVYLIAAFDAPLYIVGNLFNLLALIPIVSFFVFCLSIPFFIYILRLYISAIQAAHRLNGVRAFLVLLIPFLAVMLLFCIVEVPIVSQVSKMFPPHR